VVSLPRRLVLAVVLPGLPRLPLVTRRVIPRRVIPRRVILWRVVSRRIVLLRVRRLLRVVRRRIRGLLPGFFWRAAGTALVLAGIILRLPRLVFRWILLPVARLRPRLALRTVLLPVARLRVLTRLPVILAVSHLLTLLGPKSPEGAECTPA
jgi:hypothetical protein